MSHTEKHETILQDSQQIPEETLESIQQSNQNIFTFDNISTVLVKTTTDTQCITVTTDSNIPKISVRKQTEKDTNLFHNNSASPQMMHLH